MVQPIRQPVTEYVFDIESIDDRPLGHPGQGRQRDVLAVVDDVLVDVVGQGDDVVLLAEAGDELELGPVEDLARRVVRRVHDDRPGPRS